MTKRLKGTHKKQTDRQKRRKSQRQIKQMHRRKKWSDEKTQNDKTD